MARRAIIMGAAGRDFHNFNTFFRNDPNYEVVAFTATQIPFIQDRLYPPELAGALYPKGIPIYGEERLEELIERYEVDDVFFSYSDVSHVEVMHKASTALAGGPSFHLLGPRDTMLEAKKPVIAVLAVRTGAGKSTVSRKVAEVVKQRGGIRPVIIRHPMPYRELRFPVQRFEKAEDLDFYKTTIEEREEYEGHMARGLVVYAGIDYELILKKAEDEGDLMIWDGGNNDFSFVKPDLTIVVADALRPGDEASYHPGEANLRMADLILVNKVNVAKSEDVEKVIDDCRRLNRRARIIKIRSEVFLDRPELASRRRVLVVEDGPSITHGGLSEGAGSVAARSLGATLVDPREYAVGTIREAYSKYPKMGPVLPALGYSPQQLKELEETVNSVDCDSVILGTPADLTRLIRIKRPVARVRFEVMDTEEDGFEGWLEGMIPRLSSSK